MAETAAAIEALEHVTRLAWPPARIVEDDGWLLCESGGGTRRGQSVAPIRGGVRPIDEKIDACEGFYAQVSARAVFKLTSACQPANLDDTLANRGYLRSDETRVQCVDLGSHRMALPDAAGVHLAPMLDAAWTERCNALGGASGADANAHASTLARVAARAEPCVFASIDADGVQVALGLGVCAGTWLYLGELVTDPSRRGHGLGTSVAEALLAWGRARGARRAVLQVVADNHTAQRIYNRLGFRDHHSYWYREQAKR